MTPQLPSHDEELYLAQRTFRTVMDVMARPGRLHELPQALHKGIAGELEKQHCCSADFSETPACSRDAASLPCAGNPWLQSLVHTLIDSSCTLCGAARDTHAFLEGIVTSSSATVAPPAQARFALISADASPEQASQLLLTLSGGSDLAPELGATVIIECTRLGSEVSVPGDAAVVAQHAASPEARFDALPQDTAAVFAVTGPGVKEQHTFAASSSWWFAAREKRCDEFPCGIDLILVDPAGRVVALPRSAHITYKGEA
ncbi:MAG: phosphonate C-P lyase system protein PhnH [Coriobacteriales bacterium]|jgi:alpha-D-ribose 1-methylphosphonate 5-triphosphate synthase subunit PhnH|nr:phosphonate C-P lyase system protein PhnH [Coriobacteriales bacterium]